MPATIVGRRHRPGCLCGCHWTEGQEGALKVNTDTPKLRELGGGVYVFPDDGVRGHEVEIYWSRAELAA